MQEGAAPGTRQVAVTFAAQRCGSFAVTWAQQEIWGLRERIRPRHAYFTFQHVLRIPPGRTVEDVTRALGRLVERHEALRTTVRCTDDGQLRQDVHARGEYRLGLVETGPERLRATLGELWDASLNRAFEDDEWPLEVVLVTTAGRPAAAVLLASHLMLDWYALMLLADELAAELAGAGSPAPPAWQPVDQAVAEASPRGQRLGRRAVEFWGRQLRAAPPTMFPAAAETGSGQRFWPSVRLRSPALASTARLLAARRGHAPGDVVLAAAALLIGLRAGAGSTALRIITANRFTPELRTMVGTCAQTGLFVVDLSDCPFSEFVDRSWAAWLQACRHSRYPEPLLRQEIRDITRERGAPPDLGAFVHNMTEADPAADPRTEPPEPPELPEPAALAAQLTRTTVRRGAVFPRWRRFNLEVRDGAGALELLLENAPEVLSRDEAEALLRGIEKLVVHAVHEDVPVHRVPELVGLVQLAVPG